MTRLSPNFTLAELTHSQTAVRQGLDNTPSAAVLETLRKTAIRMEAVRQVLGKPISVSSGYRSPKVNAAVGGAPTSAHLSGHAVDFNSFSFGDPLAVCRAIVASGVQFDQLIEEGTWVHISFDPRMRGEILTKKPGGGYALGLRR